MKKILFLLMLTFSLFGCYDQIDERYDRDSQFAGSLYTLLESKGDYKLFLQAIDSSGLTRSIKGRGNHSVMAPNDSVFYAYLKKRNLSEVYEIPPSELKAIVETHIVDKPFSQSMIREFMESVPLRLHTLYQKGVEKHLDVKEDEYKLVYTANKLMPIFTPENWADQKINDIAYNYDFFYDNKWQGGKWKYGEATVESDVEQVGNGFLYKVDQILEPSFNIEEYMTRDSLNSKYKTLKKLFETYQLFLHDDELTEYYGGVDKERVYLKYNMSFSPVDISSEYINVWENSYFYLTPILADQTVIAPNDNALNAFINEELINDTWTSFDEIPIFNKLMLLSSLCVAEYVWPEKIDDDLALGTFSIPISFSTKNDVEDQYICSNGIFYGLNKMPDMALFNSVIRELMINPDYSYMANMLVQTIYLSVVGNDFQNYTFLLPPNDTWGASGLAFDQGDPELLFDEKLEYIDFVTNAETFANRWLITDFVGNHILKGDGLDLDGGYKLFETINKFGVVLFEQVAFDDFVGTGVSSAGTMEGSVPAYVLGDAIPASNGEYIEIGKPLAFARTPMPNVLDAHVEKEFVKLMKDAELMTFNDRNRIWSIPSLVGGNTTIFIPTDEAMNEAKKNGFFPEKPVEFEEERPTRPPNHASQEEKDQYKIDLDAYLSRKAEAEDKMEQYSLIIEKFVKNHIVPMAPFQRMQYLLSNQDLHEEFVYDVKLFNQNNDEYEIGVYVVMNETENTISNLSRTESANIILDKDIKISGGALIYKIDKVIDFNK